MSLNGITGYSYGYTNPYAVSNGYYNTNFQGMTMPQSQYVESEEKNGNTGLIAAGIGILAAAGTALYAIKKGKSVNGDGAKLLDNLKTGFQEIGKTITNTAKNAFKNVSEKLEYEKTLKQKAKAVENAGVPHSNKYVEKAMEEYQEELLKPFQQAYEETINSPVWRRTYF